LCSSQSCKREAVAHGGTTVLTLGTSLGGWVLGHMAVSEYLSAIPCLSDAPMGNPCYVSLHSSLPKPRKTRNGRCKAMERSHRSRCYHRLFSLMMCSLPRCISLAIFCAMVFLPGHAAAIEEKQRRISGKTNPWKKNSEATVCSLY
jgi:hypothetical protein